MRYNNVKFTAIATYSDGSMSNCRAFATEKAMSNWANKQYNKDEGCTVTVWVGYTDTAYCIIEKHGKINNNPLYIPIERVSCNV